MEEDSPLDSFLSVEESEVTSDKFWINDEINMMKYNYNIIFFIKFTAHVFHIKAC